MPYIAAGIATLGGLPPVLHLSDSQAVLPGPCRHGDLALEKTDTKVVRRLAVHRSIGSADSDAISTFSAERILPSIRYFAADCQPKSLPQLSQILTGNVGIVFPLSFKLAVRKIILAEYLKALFFREAQLP